MMRPEGRSGFSTETHDPHCPTRWLMECQCHLIRRVREDMQYRIDALETRLRMLAEEEKTWT